MALIKCPECGRGVSDTAVACPGCTCALRASSSGIGSDIPPKTLREGAHHPQNREPGWAPLPNLRSRERAPSCWTPLSNHRSRERAPSCWTPLPNPLDRRVFKRRIWLLVVPTALLFGLGIGAIASFNHPTTLPSFSEAQREAAQGFWDTVVDQYAKVGLIARYESADGAFVMYVKGEQWRLLSHQDKKAFLANLSRSNEILGRPVQIEIRDQLSGRVYAASQPPHHQIFE
jgi:hypothetical protein